MFGQLGDLMSMMGNLGKLKEQYARTMEELKARRIEGMAGGEQVKVTVNGLGELIDVTIAPELVAAGDAEMIEDLIVAAFASATEQQRQAAQEQLGQLAGGLPMDSLKGLLGG